ncbi:helix-turn-helix domain-containing protein [Pseudofrankia sp. BMG5.37]|nr:helix-turn-helix domain-containing protein [Pseudofrankia sp. BMG5.37]
MAQRVDVRNGLVEDEDIEILILRHQLAVPHRQLDGQRIQFQPADRAPLAALLHALPRPTLRSLPPRVRPESVRRWHRNLIARKHAAASRPKRSGRPRTVRSIRAPVLRLAQENSSWGYRRIHVELLVLGVKVAPSTVWDILHQAGIAPSPERTATTWADFLRAQAHAILAADFFETVTLTGTRLHILAVIEHSTLRIRIMRPDLPGRTFRQVQGRTPSSTLDSSSAAALVPIHGTRTRRLPVTLALIHRRHGPRKISAFSVDGAQGGTTLPAQPVHRICGRVVGGKEHHQLHTRRR